MNPDEGLSDEERHTRYSQGRAEFERRYEAWIQSLDISSLDYRTLRRAELLGFFDPPLGTLDEAVRSAELIVVGEVEAIRPSGHSSVATLRVEENLKGSSKSSIDVTQAGGFAPTPDWKGVRLTGLSSAPTLVPGDRVLLILEEEGGEFHAQNGTGTYRLESSGVVPSARNPFSSEVEGKSRSAFASDIRAALARIP